MLRALFRLRAESGLLDDVREIVRGRGVFSDFNDGLIG